MATALALIAAAIFALSTVLQQRGGLSVFIVFGDPAGGRTDAPNWQWFLSIAIIAVLCGVLLSFGGDRARVAVRAGAYGTVAGILSGLAATVAKPTVELLHTSGVSGVLESWMVYVLAIAGLVGVLLQQIALQTGKLAPAVATGSVANPVGVLLGIAILQERLAPPTWHKAVAFAALGCALAAAVAIPLSESGSAERRRHA